MTIQCPSCKQGISPGEFIGACSRYWRELNVVRFVCPLCQKSTEACIESTRISLGYTYAAGSPHFCGMEEFQVTELHAWPQDEGLMVRMGNHDNQC
jgi:hypothetical protein